MATQPPEALAPAPIGSDYIAGSVAVFAPFDMIARTIARAVVEKGLATCANLVPQITSVYEWKGKIEEDSEVTMMIKTQTALAPPLTEFIYSVHPYEVVEVISLSVQQGNLPYLHWGSRMATHTNIQSAPSPEEIKLRRLRTTELVEKNLWRLSKKEQLVYTYGPLYLGTISSFCGSLANYLFRHCMKVKQHPFQTFVPLAAIPFLTTAVTYKFLVTDPLSSGDLTMDMGIFRGAFVSTLCGVFHPSALAFLKNGRLAVKYETVPLPPRGRNLYHWTILCQSAAKLMVIPMIMQIMYGGHLAFLQYKICNKIFELLEHD